MSGIRFSFCQWHDAAVIATRSRPDRGLCQRAIRFCVTGEGGATPAGRPAPQGAGSRSREFEGVAPPSPVTLSSTPHAANSAASPTTIGRRKVIVLQGLCGGTSGALLRLDGRTTGPAEGPPTGPADLQAAGPISTPPPAIRIGYRSTAIPTRPIPQWAPA